MATIIENDSDSLLFESGTKSRLFVPKNVVISNYSLEKVYLNLVYSLEKVYFYTRTNIAILC